MEIILMPWGFLAWIGFLLSGKRAHIRNIRCILCSADDFYFSAALFEKFEDVSGTVVSVSSSYSVTD